jgi:large subunit ribosomal protein L29
MKAARWRDLSDDEMRQRLRELTEEVFNLRFQLAMGVAKNPSRLREVRRDLARARTIPAGRAARTPSGGVAGAATR